MAFNRVIELTSGAPGETGVVLRDLYMSFDVEKFSDASQNTIKVSVHNLSSASASRVRRAGNRLILRAGYADEVIAALGFGDVVYSTYKRDDADMVLELEARDGHQELSAAVISISRESGTAVRDVLTAMTDQLGLPVVGLGNVSATERYVNGFAFCGPVREGLAQVCGRLGLTYSVQNKQLVILGPASTSDVLGLHLTPDTGLLSLEPVEDKENAPDESAALSRWNLRALLFPQIVPGARLKIVNERVQGYFRVESSKFSGDNRDDDFVVDAEIVDLGGLQSQAVRREKGYLEPI
jgi:hypothetical protein